VTVTPSWDPQSATYRDDNGNVVAPPSAWESVPPNGNGGPRPLPPQPMPDAGGPPYAPVPTYPPLPPEDSAEGWVYVDPDSYSDPYAPTPVYHSGPQATPVAPPPASIAYGPSDVAFAPSSAGPPPPPTDWPQPSPSPEGRTPGAPAAPGVTDYQSGMVPPVTAAPVVAPTDGSYAPHPIPGPQPAAVGPGAALAGGDQGVPDKGDLKIKERRSWRTSQLVLVALLAAVIGMWFNGSTGSAGGSGSAGARSGYKLPPPTGSSPSTTAAAAAGASSPTTTAAGGATTSTTAAGASTVTTAPVVVAPPTVLIPQTTQSGNWTSPAFTIAGGTWNVGWAFQCVPAPTGGAAFQIFVVTAGGTPGSTAAVSSSDASGNAITPLTSTGSQQLVVQTTAACRWAVKVTGSGS